MSLLRTKDYIYIITNDDKVPFMRLHGVTCQHNELQTHLPIGLNRSLIIECWVMRLISLQILIKISNATKYIKSNIQNIKKTRTDDPII